MERLVVFVSDHTGVTAEVLGRSLLARFDGLELRTVTRSFIDDLAKATALAAELAELSPPPLLFTTLADRTLLGPLERTGLPLFDLFAPFLSPLSTLLGASPSARHGTFHAIHDLGRYQERIAAVEYSLSTDDGVGLERYDLAEVVVIGVSRVGKTPTCLYMALQYGTRAANYPLTEEDFGRGGMPPALRAVRERLYGLTIDPLRLHQLRAERRSGSDYADLERCHRDVAAAERLFRRHGIPFQNTTTTSVEEIAARVRLAAGLKGQE